MSNDFEFKDLTVGQLNSLVKILGGHEQVLQILSGKFKIQLLSTMSDQVITILVETFLTVEADILFEERITRGQYSWNFCGRGLTEKMFPVTSDQVGDWVWKLFYFNCRISSKEASQLMREDGYNVGTIGHLLAFGRNTLKNSRGTQLSVSALLPRSTCAPAYLCCVTTLVVGDLVSVCLIEHGMTTVVFLVFVDTWWLENQSILSLALTSPSGEVFYASNSR